MRLFSSSSSGNQFDRWRWRAGVGRWATTSVRSHSFDETPIRHCVGSDRVLGCEKNRRPTFCTVAQFGLFLLLLLPVVVVVVFLFNYPIRCSNNIFLSDIYVCYVRARAHTANSLKIANSDVCAYQFTYVWAWAWAVSSLLDDLPLWLIVKLANIVLLVVTSDGSVISSSPANINFLFIKCLSVVSTVNWLEPFFVRFFAIVVARWKTTFLSTRLIAEQYNSIMRKRKKEK